MGSFSDQAPTVRPRVAPYDPAAASAFRREAEGMAEAYRDALLDLLPAGSIDGIYAKGSAFRSWDSVVDYVPEFSDVDIHVRFTASSPAVAHLETLAGALDLASRAVSFSSARFPTPSHSPRPQLLFLDDLEGLPGYLASPPGSVRTLHGRAYVGGSRADYADTRLADHERLKADSKFVLGDVPMKVIDRPGPLMWRVVFLLTWRVGPAGPRILTQLGADPYEVWQLNRTALVRELSIWAGERVAGAYEAFYLAGLDGFRSRFADGDAARRALVAADEPFREGLAVVAGRTQVDVVAGSIGPQPLS